MRATGGEKNPLNERRSARKNRIFASKGIDGRNSMRAEAKVGNGEIAEMEQIHLHFCRVLGERSSFYCTKGGAKWAKVVAGRRRN